MNIIDIRNWIATELANVGYYIAAGNTLRDRYGQRVTDERARSIFSRYHTNYGATD